MSCRRPGLKTFGCGDLLFPADRDGLLLLHDKDKNSENDADKHDDLGVPDQRFAAVAAGCRGDHVDLESFDDEVKTEKPRENLNHSCHCITPFGFDGVGNGREICARLKFVNRFDNYLLTSPVPSRKLHSSTEISVRGFSSPGNRRTRRQHKGVFLFVSDNTMRPQGRSCGEPQGSPGPVSGLLTHMAALFAFSSAERALRKSSNREVHR